MPFRDRLPTCFFGAASTRLVLAAALCVFTLSCQRSSAAPGTSDDTLHARTGTLTLTHLLTGELQAERAVELTAPDVGVRPLEIRWVIENGSRVEAEERLFAFDNSHLAAELEERRLAVLEAEAELEAARSEAGSAIAEAEFEVERRRAELEKARIDAEIPKGLKSEEEYERRQTELRKAERALADAERALESAGAIQRAEVEKHRLELEEEQAELRQAEAGVEELFVTAPQAGVVLLERNDDTERPWELGDMVYPGEKLARLPDLASLVVRARLFDVDDGTIAPGMAATVSFDPFPALEHPGRVRQVDDIAFQRRRDSSTRIFWVVVELEEADLASMRPGMSAKVEVRNELGADGEDLVVAPRESLDLADPDTPRVRLADGTWRRVTLGPCAPLECVIEEGLVAGTALGRARTAPHGSEVASR